MPIHSVIQELKKPGRELLFIDDGGTPEKPLDGLVKDFLLFTGVLLHSDCYEEIEDVSKKHLLSVSKPPEKLHSVEIVNPGRKSEWKDQSFEYRNESLLLLKSLVLDYGKIFPYLFIGAQQFEEIVRNAGVKAGKHKAETKKVFYKAIYDSEWFSDHENIVIYASDRDYGSKMKVQRWKDKKGIIIEMLSKHAVGLQLADYVAYTMNRMFHIRDRIEIKNKKLGMFDSVILDSHEEMQPRLIDVLEQKDEKWLNH